MTKAQITSSSTTGLKTVHVVSKDGVTLDWIHEVASKGMSRSIWADYVGNMQFGDTPMYNTIREALASFK